MSVAVVADARGAEVVWLSHPRRVRRAAKVVPVPVPVPVTMTMTMTMTMAMTMTLTLTMAAVDVDAGGLRLV